MLTANDVKYYASLKQKKHSREQKKFLIEGFHLIEECLSSPYNLEIIILRNGTDLTNKPAILSAISKNKTKVESLPEKSFNKLTDTESSQGIIGVVTKPKTAKNDLGEIVIALDGINDPGNMGTIIRTAYWFGVKSVIAGEGSADIFNQKVIRASQGAVFYTNVYEDVNLNDKLKKLIADGYKVYLFTLAAKMTLSTLNKSGKSVIVFGSESHGISEELIKGDYEQVKIEGYSKAESLNAAISCGIALYAFTSK